MSSDQIRELERVMMVWWFVKSEVIVTGIFVEGLGNCLVESTRKDLDYFY